MDPEVAYTAVDHALRKGASYAEVRLEMVENSSLLMKNGVLEVSDFSRMHGAGIRAMVDGSMGFSSADGTDKASILKACEEAVRLAKATARLRKNPIHLADSDMGSASWKTREKHPIRDVSIENGVALLQEVEKSVKECDAHVPARLFQLLTRYREKLIINSNGSEISCRQPLVMFYYLITVARPGKGTAQRSFTYAQSSGWEAIQEWGLPGSISRDAAALDENLRRGRKAPKGRVDVIIGPEITGIAVHESAGHPYEADRILGREAAQAGESFIRMEMLGQRIGSSAVNVADDPRIERSAGYYLYDDEGVKARKRLLIKDGRINEFLHNRESAAAFGVESNAAARASSYDREPIVRMSTTYMLPGDYTQEELLEDVKHGVYIKSFMEWNIDDTRFHQRYVGSEAYVVVNGDIGAPVRQPVLELTTPALYKSIDAVSDTVEFYAGNCGKGEPMQGIPVWMGGPAARLRNIRLG
jgi:TldD protein